MLPDEDELDEVEELDEDELEVSPDELLDEELLLELLEVGMDGSPDELEEELLEDDGPGKSPEEELELDDAELLLELDELATIPDELEEELDEVAGLPPPPFLPQPVITSSVEKSRTNTIRCNISNPVYLLII